MSRRKVLYMAATERGRFATQYNYAVVTTGAYTTERLAMRHARAMLEVQRDRAREGRVGAAVLPGRRKVVRKTRVVSRTCKQST